MNGVDLVIVGVLAISVLIGLWRGLISELLSLAAWIAAFWIAWALGPVVGSWLKPWVTSDTARLMVGYVICFAVVLVVGALLRVVFRRLLWSTGLSGLDRLLGMVFGFLRGVLLVSLAVFLLGFTAFTQSVWWRQSTLLPQFQGVVIWLGQNVPAGMRARLESPPSLHLDRLPQLPSSLHLPDVSGLPVLLPARAGSAMAPVPSSSSRPRPRARTP